MKHKCIQQMVKSMILEQRNFYTNLMKCLTHVKECGIQSIFIINGTRDSIKKW